MSKLRIFKSISAIALMGTITLTGLTGCAKKEKAFLSDTDLEATKVISFKDDHRDIAVVDSADCYNTTCDYVEHQIYRSIITNEYFADDECNAGIYYQDNYHTREKILNHYNIINVESVVSYLTADEIAKAAKGALTDDDVLAIVNRILGNETEKTNTK